VVMLKISAFGNADKKLSINYLAYPIGCEVSDANAVLRKHYVRIVNAGKLMLTFRSQIGGKVLVCTSFSSCTSVDG
jgi:hypothetical protein